MYKYKSLKVGQLPWQRLYLSFVQNILNFIITKYLKQEDNNNLSAWVDGWKYSLWPLSNCRYKYLQVPHDQKVMALLPPVEKCPINFLS